MECPACNKAVRPNGLSIPAASSKYTCASCGAHNSHAPNAQAEGTDEKQWEEYEFEATAWNADGKVLEARCRVCPTVYKSRFLAALLDAHRKTPSHKLRAAKGSQTANESDDPQDDVDETQNSKNYVPFITPAQRKRQRQEKFESGSHALKKTKEENTNKEQDASDGEGKQATFAERDITSYQPDRSVALLDVSHEINKNAEADPEYAKWLKQEDERKVLETITVQQKTLKSAKELADGIEYTESIVTGWTAPRHIRNQGKEAHDRMRKKWHILVEGEDVPPPIKSFKDMRFPKGVMEALAAKGIKRPTPIQVQGLPVALSGRDMIGIAFTGSGKTMTFTLPMVMVALGEELKLPLVGNEGPFGLILGPSRELQRQTYEVVQHFTSYLQKAGFPELRCTLAIGGEDKRPQLDLYWRKGVHMIVATPGRLNDFLKQKKINLESCKYICLDEGDRMMDLGFDEEVQHTLGYFKGQRQMLLFSATMPKKFVDFAKTALVRPVTVNVGRAGAANLDVIQEVEYVKQEAKIVYLLQCLQKTAPPVLIFCERKQDVDDIHEYLLLKGVEAVAIHGGKDQADRNWAIDQFKLGRKDVLVATDIAAKGLDFPAIQHVINFDMPEEIENYVHRIGRTGRGGRTGVATTFINKGVELHALMDLKHLLKEAKQRIPPALMMYPDPTDEQGGSGDEGDELGKGCSYCGGLGHRITSCPKLQGVAKSQQAGMRDIVGGAAYSGDW